MPLTPVGGIAAPIAPTVEAPTADGGAPMSPVADLEAGVPLGELDVAAPRGTSATPGLPRRQLLRRRSPSRPSRRWGRIVGTLLPTPGRSVRSSRRSPS
eukprot:11029913-Alexandrium_andersonii.AAC.1